MTDRVCKASLDTLAGELNLSRMTVIRSLRDLVTDGYLRDLSPEIRNRPHVLKVTEKLATMAKWGGIVEGITNLDTKESEGISKSDTTVTKCDSGCNNVLQPGVTICDLNQTLLRDKEETSQEKPASPIQKTSAPIFLELEGVIDPSTLSGLAAAGCKLIMRGNHDLLVQAPDESYLSWLRDSMGAEITAQLQGKHPNARVVFEGPENRTRPPAEEAWQRVSIALQPIINNPAVYQQNVAACRVIGWEGAELCVSAPDPKKRDWLIGRATPEVNRRLEVLYPGATVRFTSMSINGERPSP